MRHRTIHRADSVRAALRAATEAAHQRMHGLEPFRAIADGSLTIDRYPKLLQSLLLFHSTVGRAADAHGWTALSSAAARTGLLRSDLRGLGRGPRPPLVAWGVGSPHQALGALYAAEGSMLGGRLIARQLDYLFGAAVEGRRFLIGLDGDGARWCELMTVLEDRCAAMGALDEAIGGANSAFNFFEQCVIGVGVANQPLEALVTGPRSVAGMA